MLRKLRVTSVDLMKQWVISVLFLSLPSAKCSIQAYIQNLPHSDPIFLFGEPRILFLVANQILLHLLVAIVMNYGLSPPQSYYQRTKSFYQFLSTCTFKVPMHLQ